MSANNAKKFSFSTILMELVKTNFFMLIIFKKNFCTIIDNKPCRTYKYFLYLFDLEVTGRASFQYYHSHKLICFFSLKVSEK